MMLRTTLQVLATVAVMLPMAACDDWDMGDFGRAKEDFHYNFKLQPGGRLTVENANGTVEISTWEKNEVEVTGTKYASSQDRLNEIKIETHNDSGSVSLRTVMPQSSWMRGGNMGARYAIRVPRQITLDRITSSNGGIRVDDVEGRSTLRTSNGAIRIGRLKGELEAQTSNGTIELQDVQARATLRTSNGAIRGDIRKGSVEAATTNGSIHLDLKEMDASRTLRFETSNGSIEVGLDAARDIRAHTSNSSITMHLPTSVNARVKAHTSNSSIQSDFDVSVRGGGTIGKHDLEGTIGSGGPLIDLSTSNGGIKILHN